jgi:hypothetical protein
MSRTAKYALLLLLAWPGHGLAASATLAWNANTESNLSGYKIYSGAMPCAAAGPMLPVATVGAVTTYVLTVPDGTATVSARITATNTAGLESAMSQCAEKTFVASAATFALGQAVQAVAPGAMVRPCAGFACAAGPVYPAGTVGAIAAGPTTADGYAWWQVNWTDAALTDGWVTEPNLGPYTAPSAPPPSGPTLEQRVAAIEQQLTLLATQVALSAATDRIAALETDVKTLKAQRDALKAGWCKLTGSSITNDVKAERAALGGCP